MTNWDEIAIADYEQKWLDPDYDWENHRYRTYADEPEEKDEEETETPVFETEEEENDWQEAQLLIACEKTRKMVKCNA